MLTVYTNQTGLGGNTATWPLKSRLRLAWRVLTGSGETIVVTRRWTGSVKQDTTYLAVQK